MIKLFSFLLLFILPMFIPQIQAEERGLVSYWSFDEGEGNVAHDISGAKWYANNGKIHNPSWQTGIKGKCLLFGKGSYVEIPHTPSLGLNKTFSFEVWIKPVTLKGFQPIITKGPVSPDYYPPSSDEYSLSLQGNNLRALTWMNAEPVRILAGNTKFVDIREHEWNHLVVTGDGKLMKYYRNGIFYGICSYQNIPQGTHPLYIGYSSLQKSNYIDPPFPSIREEESFFFGCMDEIKIYNRELSSKEVRDHYAEITGITIREEIIYTPRETEMCRYVLYGLMKSDNINDTTGMPAYRKNLSLFVHNTTTKAMEIGKVAVNGESLEEIEKTDGNVAWHVIIPTVIPPYSYGEILIRCWDVDSLPMNTIDLTMWDMQGNVLDKGKVSIGKPGAAQFQSIGFQEDLREIYLYLRVDETLSIREIRCNGTRTKFRAGKTLTKHTINPIIVYPSISLEEGTHLFIEVVTNRGNNSVLTRVTQPFFPISIYRCFKYTQPNTAQAQTRYREMFGDYAEKYLTSLRKPGEKSVVPEWLDDCCDHYFNTFLGEPWVFSQNRNVQSSEEIVQLLKERKMRLGSLHEISKQGHAYEGLLYYGLADEPTGMERARKLIEKFNRIGKEAPRVPSSIVFCNLGSNPCDYTYVDRMLFDCYPVVWCDLDIVGKGVRQLSSFFAPKPVGFVIQAFRWSPMRKKGGGCRFPFPEEERFMVYDAIANGAKEISYFTYTLEPGEPTEGAGTAAMLEIPEAVKLWNEIGRINLELATLGPLLARGCVVKQEKQGDIEISYIAVGQDTFILILLNKNYEYTRESFSPVPIKNFSLSVKTPWYIRVKDLFEVSHKGIIDTQCNITKNRIILTDSELRTGKVYVLTSNLRRRQELFSRHKTFIVGHPQ
jgi:hypothetical protein